MSAEETTNNPGEVIKDDIKITTMYGRTEDITNYVLEVHLFEDIFAPYLSGEIVIDDAADIIQKFPIVGNEKVTLKFRTPTLDDDPINIISKTFFVYGIKERILNKIESDTTRPVLFSESQGGSESQLRLLFKYVPAVSLIHR